jgi:hypothetical protein
VSSTIRNQIAEKHGQTITCNLDDNGQLYKASMSLEIYSLLDQLPDRAAWQEAINGACLDLKLHLSLEVSRHEGFVPCEILGKSSGFELTVVPAAGVIREYPSLAPWMGPRQHAMCFRWSGDLAECACVLGANLALVQSFQAVAYYPSDDLFYDVAELEKGLRECVDGFTSVARE